MCKNEMARKGVKPAVFFLSPTSKVGHCVFVRVCEKRRVRERERDMHEDRLQCLLIQHSQEKESARARKSTKRTKERGSFCTLIMANFFI